MKLDWRPMNDLRQPRGRGIHGYDRLALLRGFEGPRTPAQSIQRDCRAASDWLDFVTECGWSTEPRAIQLLQRVPLRPSDNRVLLNFVEGHGQERQRDPRIRLESGYDGFRRAHECDGDAARSRRERIRSSRADGNTRAPRRGAAGRREQGRYGMQGRRGLSAVECAR